MAFLLDTSIAVDLRDERDVVVDRIAELAGPYALSLITVVELEGGVAANLAWRERRRRAVDRLLAQTTTLPFDDKIVDAYRSILTAVGFSRRRILDRLIAATAIVNDLTLITFNRPDFSDIPGLRLEVWPAPAQ